MTHALPLVVRPLIGESGLSLTSRLADVNGIMLVTLLRDIAGVRRHDTWGDVEWEKIARRSLLPVEAVEPMRARPAGVATAPAAVRFLERAVNPQYLVRDRLRICPACIGERRMLKESWRLVHHVACSDHGTQLIDTCECGRTIDTVTRHLDPFTCPCGKPFEENVAPPASADAVKAAQWMIQAFGVGPMGTKPGLWLVKGGRLGLPFSVMQPHDIMGVIDIVGQAATISAEDDEPVTPQKRWSKGNLNGRRDLASSTAQVEAAMAVLHLWPSAYRSLLAKVAGRNAAAGSARPRDLFATRIGQLMLTPYRGLDGQPLKPLQEEVDAFLVAKGYRLRRKVPTRSSATARSVQKVMPCSLIARTLGLRPNNTILNRVYRETVIAFDDRDDLPDDPEKLGKAVLAEVKRRLAAADDYMSPSATSEYLCHPDIATFSPMWVHADLLTPVQPDRSVSALIRGDAFLRVDVERMRMRIADAATPVARDAIPDGYEPYGIASKAGVDAAYTGTHLLLDLLSGAVPSVSTVDAPRLTDLFVHTATARRRALERRMARVVERDQFASTFTVQQMLDTLWPHRAERLTIDLNRRLRSDGAVRYETRTNTTEGRTRALYWYSMLDHMGRALADSGPSISAEVDRTIIEALKRRAAEATQAD